MNVAIDMEYAAAWGDESYSGNDYGDYCYDCNDGRNYAVTNDQDWLMPTKHYSMMLTKASKPITIGPKYFPAGMYDEFQKEENFACNEISSQCKCTVTSSQDITTTKNANTTKNAHG